MTIKHLNLKNIVLVEDISIPFSSGFNVLSGESGSGKSAIINALNLIAGDRCDASIIRHGTDKAVVEAIFDISCLSQLEHFLSESGIDHLNGDELYIRREITASGKSRAFINNQLAQLTILRQVSLYLFEIIGQHANQKLLSTDYHREVIDLFGGLEKQVLEFTQSFKEEIDIKSKLDSLIQSMSERLRQIETFNAEIEEIEEANLKIDEEDELFNEYTLLTNAEEIIEKTNDILIVFNSEKINISSHLRRLRSTFEQLLKLDPSLIELAKNYEAARLELEEIAHTVDRYASRIEHKPERAEAVNTRLKLIDRLKRKYGPAISDIENYLSSIRQKLEELNNADNQIDELKEALNASSLRTNKLAANLTKARTAISLNFKTAIRDELKSLNMQKAEFYVDITPQKRTRHGDEKVEFFIQPNAGEVRIQLKESASGGELSRVLLALQTLLAGKERIPTLIFDEVDANIGGETAYVVGEKLCEISKEHQVLCITHFPQVAKQSQHHYKIFKQEISGRTVTLAALLDAEGKHQEITRMMGGK